MATSSGLSDIIRGDTKQYKMSFKGKTGGPIDISDGTIWFTMKRKPDDTDAAAALQVQVAAASANTPGRSSTAVDDARHGIAYLTLSSVQTAIPVGEYYYDFQIVFPGNPPVVTTLVLGVINVIQDVTNRFV